MERSTQQLAEDVRHGWHRFVDTYEPLRPELYRYCRYLTHSAWEAEDLVQDTLARAFVNLGRSFQLPANPKAWLFRVASNLWIDRARRARERPGEVPDHAVLAESRVDREAAGSLIGRLAPQERAAVVLKDVFDFSLAEIAEALSTTVGALQTLKAEDGRDLVLFAGAGLATTAIDADLVDEYRLMVHPTVLGKGLSLFDQVQTERNLDLIGVTTFDCGVVELRYRQAS